MDRFPYLKDVICKMNSTETRNLQKLEKLQSTYDWDYKPKFHKPSKIVLKENDGRGGNNDNVEFSKPDQRGVLKKQEQQKSGFKYVGVLPPEQYTVPISEYRSTIHTIGKRIIREKLLYPRAKNIFS